MKYHEKSLQVKVQGGISNTFGIERTTAAVVHVITRFLFPWPVIMA
jgi:phage shock protein PspC (stress-responsive transcriptional regulator)